MDITDGFAMDSGPGYRGVDETSARADHIHKLSNATPLSLGTAAPGTGKYPAREDHVHPVSAPSPIGPLGYASSVFAAAAQNMVSGTIFTTPVFTVADVFITFTLTASARIKLTSGFGAFITTVAQGRFDPGFVVNGVHENGFTSEIMPVSAGRHQYIERTYRKTFAAGVHTVRLGCFFTDILAGQIQTSPNYPLWIAASRET